MCFTSEPSPKDALRNLLPAAVAMDDVDKNIAQVLHCVTLLGPFVTEDLPFDRPVCSQEALIQIQTNHYRLRLTLTGNKKTGSPRTTKRLAVSSGPSHPRYSLQRRR